VKAPCKILTPAFPVAGQLSSTTKSDVTFVDLGHFGRIACNATGSGIYQELCDQHFSGSLRFSTVGSDDADKMLFTPPASGHRPNILIIMGDDIGWFNLGAYHQGIMASRTPNLDKLAGEKVHRFATRFSISRRAR